MLLTSAFVTTGCLVIEILSHCLPCYCIVVPIIIVWSVGRSVRRSTEHTVRGTKSDCFYSKIIINYIYFNICPNAF